MGHEFKKQAKREGKFWIVATVIIVIYLAVM